MSSSRISTNYRHARPTRFAPTCAPKTAVAAGALVRESQKGTLRTACRQVPIIILSHGGRVSYLATDAVGQRIIPDARPPSRRRWRALQRSGRLVVAVGIVLVHSRPGVNLAAHGCGKRRRRRALAWWFVNNCEAKWAEGTFEETKGRSRCLAA